MDTIFIKHGIEFIRWTDENNDIWEAELEAVKFFGKECFEQYPGYHEGDPNLGSWSVTYDEENLPNYEPVTDEEWEEIINL